MTCRTYRKLAAYQAGALDEAQRAEVARHLPGCPQCQAELAALERTAVLLRPMPQVDAPREVWHQVAVRLTPRREQQHRRQVQWMAACAAVLLILIVGAALLLPGLQGPANGPHVAMVAAEMPLSGSWNNPLSDKAALGLAVLATGDDPNVLEAVD